MVVKNIDNRWFSLLHHIITNYYLKKKIKTKIFRENDFTKNYKIYLVYWVLVLKNKKAIFSTAMSTKKKCGEENKF